mgnify:CR=1 FL=1
MIKSDTLDARVCMVVNQDYFSDTRVISYANALANVGAQVDVIASQQKSRQATNQHSNIRIHTIPIARNYSNSIGYILNYCLSILLFTIYTAFFFFRSRYHVIHIHNMPDALIIAAIIPKLLGSKVFLDIHDPMPEFFMSKYKKGADSIFVKMLKAQERISSRLADEIITANPLFKQRLSQRGIPSEKVLVINNIPNPKTFNRQGAKLEKHNLSKKFALVYPGTIAPRYCLDIPILALPRLRKEIPNIQLNIIGKHTQYYDKLAQLADQLSVSKYINKMPLLPAELVAQEIAKADIGIYTALPDPHMSIAMPGKVLEYATMGIPIIASRLPILKAFFDDSAILFFTPGDIDEFISHVLRLHYDQNLKGKLVANADKCFTDKYLWKDEFKQYTNKIHLLC